MIFLNFLKSAGCFIFLQLCTLLVYSCGVKNPKVSEDFSDPNKRRAHLSFTECAVCHEETRPPQATHPYPGDCVTCHQYPNWANTL